VDDPGGDSGIYAGLRPASRSQRLCFGTADLHLLTALGESSLEMAFERMPLVPDLRSIYRTPNSEDTEAYSFYVADYPYTSGGTHGGSTGSQNGITVIGAMHDDCNQIGPRFGSFEAQLVDWAGENDLPNPFVGRFQEQIPKMDMFTLEGADGVSAGCMCGLGALFSFHRITDTRWTKSGQRLSITLTDIHSLHR
jgi:hypothetical protein